MTRWGRALAERGYGPVKSAHALGILAWHGKAMDGTFWRRKNVAEGRMATQVDLLIRGNAATQEAARDALGDEAWDAGVICEADGSIVVTGMVLAISRDLIWTDRADRAFQGADGLFIPDSTSMALRRCLPPARVGRHLDLGCGAGAVTVAAARNADEVVAVDLNLRAVDGCYRSAALNGLDNVGVWIGDALGSHSLGTFDQITFVLPLLVPWVGLADTQVHTVANRDDLLSRLVQRLPDMLCPGGRAILYCQDWVGGEPLPVALARSFGSRPFRGLFWWDYEGETPKGTLRAGVMIVEADRAGDWRSVEREAPDEGCDDWWPWIERHLNPE